MSIQSNVDVSAASIFPIADLIVGRNVVYEGRSEEFRKRPHGVLVEGVFGLKVLDVKPKNASSRRQ